MYEIAEFDNAIPGNNAVNVKNGRNVKYESFKDLAERFRECKKGSKHDRYFSRGRIAGPDGEFHRRDDYLGASNLFIIDGDSTRQSDGTGAKGAPAISLVRDVFESLQLSYCLYTSHSHTSESNRYRIIVPLTETINKEQLKIIAPNIIGHLNNSGLPIGWGAGEHNRWSQPWYEPTRTNPDDGLFQWHYSEAEALDPNEFMEVNASGDASADVAPSTKLSWKEHMEKVQLGDFHEHIRPMVWGMISDGMDKSIVESMAESLMASVPGSLKDDRWQTRLADIPRSIEGAIKKLDEEDKISMAGIEYKEESVGDVPWPPGRLGEFTQLSYDMMVYQYREIALINALVVAGTPIARCFNVDSGPGISLNAYYTLVADTGMGKEGLSSWPSTMFNLVKPDLTSSPSFLGTNSFTGPKAFHDELVDSHSKLFILREAGFLLGQQMGNQAGLQAMMLDAYSKGHEDGQMSAAAYSSTDNSFGSLVAANPTIVSESTPGVLMQAYADTDAMDSGHLPRQTILRIRGEKPMMNRSVKRIKRDDDNPLVKKLEHLYKKGAEQQAKKIPDKVHLIDFWDRDVAFSFSDRCTAMYNELRFVDPRRAVMATRMFVKACKFAGIATVFNKEPDSEGCVTIEKAEWDWAVRLCEYEMDVVSSVFEGAFGMDKMEDLAIRVLGKLTKKLLDRDLAIAKKHISRKEAEKGKFKLFILKQSLKNQQEINDLKNNSRSGFEVMMDYMVRQGYLYMKDEGKVKMVFITQNFVTALEYKD